MDASTLWFIMMLDTLLGKGPCSAVTVPESKLPNKLAFSYKLVRALNLKLKPYPSYDCLITKSSEGLVQAGWFMQHREISLDRSSLVISDYVTIKIFKSERFIKLPYFILYVSSELCLEKLKVWKFCRYTYLDFLCFRLFYNSSKYRKWSQSWLTDFLLKRSCS